MQTTLQKHISTSETWNIVFTVEVRLLKTIHNWKFQQIQAKIEFSLENEFRRDSLTLSKTILSAYSRAHIKHYNSMNLWCKANNLTEQTLCMCWSEISMGWMYKVQHYPNTRKTYRLLEWMGCTVWMQATEKCTESL